MQKSPRVGKVRPAWHFYAAVYGLSAHPAYIAVVTSKWEMGAVKHAQDGRENKLHQCVSRRS